MQNSIKNEIKRISKRIISKQDRSIRKEESYRRKFERRTGVSAGVGAGGVAAVVSRHFDPIYCARNANFLAKTIWFKILNNQYEPQPAIHYEIPKPDGGKRDIMAFTIPDAAVANVMHRRASERNLKKLSPFSYAYHPNRNVFDAVLALNEYDTSGKLFAVQIDFLKYFDNIPKWYMKKKYEDRNSVSLTPHEKFVFGKFLEHRYANIQDYNVGIFQNRRTGTPQGSSISLFLANLANHDLDIALASEAGKFVRFADDVVAMCDDYSRAQALERKFFEHCAKSGLKINEKKSPGTAVISSKEQEIRTYGFFDFLGYRFTDEGLGVPAKVERKLIEKVSRLINIYLIQYLRYGFNGSRASISPLSFDWDLLGLIYELRNSLYGGLSEAQIGRFLSGGQRLPQMKGIMGFYCLIDDPTTLKRLDGQILSLIRRAMVQRDIILRTNYHSRCPTPANAELATGSWLDLAAWSGAESPESGVPSLMRGWRAARKHYFTFGLEGVVPPTYAAYEDFGSIFDFS